MAEVGRGRGGVKVQRRDEGSEVGRGRGGMKVQRRDEGVSRAWKHGKF